jgi:organic radical activating enzyme
MVVDEMVNEILPYKPYFDASGGGVTVSGGEPLLQMPFLEKLISFTISSTVTSLDGSLIFQVSGLWQYKHLSKHPCVSRTFHESM